MMTPNILVLMSTYNGEKYIREQIDSILAQKDVNVKLLVRDDGSKDSTLSILDTYSKDGNLSYYTGGNLGPQLSFMHLLHHAPESDYYAFADQDDFWMPDKLSTAINSIKEYAEKPALYFSQTQLADENLNPRQSVIINPKLTFGESLIYKFIGGCTMVMNHQLRIRLSDKLPAVMPMHDIWVYSAALSFDAYIHFDKEPHILYRQHDNNAVGQGQGALYEWKLRWKRFLTHSGERSTQAQGLYDCYKDIMPEHNRGILEKYLNGKKSFATRMSLLFDKNMVCSHKLTLLLFRIELLFNKY